jgi:hypothetical protein
MIARFLILALLAMTAACAPGGGLIPNKGGGEGPIHCHGAKCG